MEAFLIMLKNVAIFVLLAIPGYLLVKKKMVKPTDTGVLSTLLTWLGMPFLILSGTLNINFSGEFVRSLLAVGAIGVLFNLLMIVLSAVITKKDDGKKRGIMRFAMVYTNSGFLGIPLASAVFGSNSLIVIYIILLNIISNLFLFTVGVYLISGDKSHIQIKKAVLNPVLIAFILGIILSYNQTLIQIGIWAFSLAVLFQLVTLPVEFNASHRAVAKLEQFGIVTSEENRGSKKVLRAAALTYVAALATAVANLLRILVIRGRND